MTKQAKIAIVVVILACIAGAYIYVFDPFRSGSSSGGSPAKLKKGPSGSKIVPDDSKLIYEYDFTSWGYEMFVSVGQRPEAMAAKLRQFTSYPANVAAEGIRVKGVVTLRPKWSGPQVVVDGTVQPFSSDPGARFESFNFTSSEKYSELFGDSYDGKEPYSIDVSWWLPQELTTSAIEEALLPERFLAPGQGTGKSSFGGSKPNMTTEVTTNYFFSANENVLGRDCVKYDATTTVTSYRGETRGDILSSISIDATCYLSTKDNIIVGINCTSGSGASTRWPNSGVDAKFNYDYKLVLKLKSVEEIKVD